MRTRWLLGLKLGQEDRGALTFLGWLRGTRAETQLLAQHTMPAFATGAASDLQVAADAALREALAQIGFVDPATAVLPGGAPEENLARAAGVHAVEAIVVGRRATARETRLVRLGSVARRLLRVLPVPVLVVPPEVSSSGVPIGPVVLALDGETDAHRAVTFARRMCEIMKRPLALAHVAPAMRQIAAPYIPTAYWGRAQSEVREAARRRLQTQIEALDLGDTPLLEREDGVVAGLTQIGSNEQASMIVCSSRRMAVTDRIFSLSVGSALAATADFPVAVVPSAGAR